MKKIICSLMLMGVMTMSCSDNNKSEGESDTSKYSKLVEGTWVEKSVDDNTIVSEFQFFGKEDSYKIVYKEYSDYPIEAGGYTRLYGMDKSYVYVRGNNNENELYAYMIVDEKLIIVSAINPREYILIRK